MRFTLLSFIFCIVSATNALHFYLDANQKRCFIEELPTDTIVEGNDLLVPCVTSSSLIDYLLPTGHYRAREWSEQQQAYAENSELGIIVDVEVCLFCLASCIKVLKSP